jgi:toxin ParE1/3/4
MQKNAWRNVEIIWTEHAINDWEAVAAYHAATSVRVMNLIMQEIERGVSRLSVFPKSGRVVPELGNDNIREIVSNRYRVIYEINGDDIFILTIHPCLLPFGKE